MTQIKYRFNWQIYFLEKYLRSGVSCIKNVRRGSYFCCKEKESVRYWTFISRSETSKSSERGTLSFLRVVSKEN